MTSHIGIVEGITFAFGAAMVTFSFVRERTILSDLSGKSEIAKTPEGTLFNAAMIAIKANTGRLLHFDTGESERLYDKHYRQILVLVTLLTANIACIFTYILSAASAIFDTRSGLAALSGNWEKLSAFGISVIFVTTLSEIIKSDVIKNKPDDRLIGGKRSSSPETEKPRSLPTQEFVMTKRDAKDIISASTLPLEQAPPIPNEAYPEENRAAFQQLIKDPDAARKYLRDGGFIDENGQLSVKYRRS
ncbi:hypothetical protein [Methylorubrum populi]|uniref:hypothetical protein n=1 Tax=Methylorubrum populi TaxID=223967 RepID=UPI003F65F3D0